MTDAVGVFVDLPDGETVVAGRLAARMSQAGLLLGTEFQYARSYLRDPRGYALSPELPLSAAPLAAAPRRPMLGAFADSQPDRWGRNLIYAAERRRERTEGRRVGVMTEMDFLLGVRDDTRQGALRFSLDAGRTFVAPPRGDVPALVDLPALVDAARRHLDRAETDDDLALLIRAGTSMGGARPKATVRKRDGRLAIAKLPSPDDRWNVLAWEAVTLDLARRAGIRVPPFEAHAIDADRSVLVVERFDRDATGRRVGYLSAHTLVQKEDLTPVSYAEFAGHLAEESAEPEIDTAELFRRVALTLLVTNVDDHLRNHGAIRAPGGWRLSPVFDVNPFPGGAVVDSTPLSPDDAGIDREIGNLVETADFYGLTPSQAVVIVGEVAVATAVWPEVAAAYGIEREEIDFMASAFESENRAEARGLTGAGG